MKILGGEGGEGEGRIWVDKGGGGGEEGQGEKTYLMA